MFEGKQVLTGAHARQLDYTEPNYGGVRRTLKLGRAEPESALSAPGTSLVAPSAFLVSPS